MLNNVTVGANTTSEPHVAIRPLPESPVDGITVYLNPKSDLRPDRTLAGWTAPITA
jgi:hypothetical protein